MDSKANAPIIIKRKKVIAGGGHHGGAWKVAYADFVTAMMAFFMLMWLLNATTEQQRKGIADYFAPTISVARISGGGEGALSGDSVFTRQTMAASGRGGVAEMDGRGMAQMQQEAADIAALRDVEAALLGFGGESVLSDNALRHVVTRLTDEGLVIEVFDLPSAPLFIGETDTPTPVTEEIAAMLARILGVVKNDVAVTGHVRTSTEPQPDNLIWNLTTSRASRTRLLLEAGGLDDGRISRLTGAGDRNPAISDTASERNNRVAIIVLRSDQ
jgi:chemotaxis protein MotB